MAIHPTEKHNLTRWQGEKGFYEVYYITFNDPERKTGFWIRYTLLAPLTGESVAEVWFSFFSFNSPSQNFSVKKTYPAGKAHISRESFSFIIGDSGITHDRIWGKIHQDGKDISWELSFERLNEDTFFHFPLRAMYRLPFPHTKVLSPGFDLRISGRVNINGAHYHFQGAPGQQTHLWGSKHAPWWTWSHCNAFEEEESASMELISARVNLGKLFLPPVTLIYVEIPEGKVRTNLFQAVFSSKSKVQKDRWSVTAKCGKWHVECTVKFRETDLTRVFYTDPDGEKVECFNTEVASSTLKIYAGRKPVKELTSNSTTAFEIAHNLKFSLYR